MRKFFYQWGGSIIMVIAFLIGVPDSFSAFRDMVAWASPFGMQPIHLAFWLLGTGAIYTTIAQGIRIRNLEKSRPQIMVEPKVYENQAFLEVYNSGAYALFQATARVTATSIPPQIYVMYWEDIGSSCRIDKDGHGTIKVAERAKQTILQNRDAETAIYEGGLVGFKMGTSGEQIFPIRTFEEAMENFEGVEKIVGRIKDKGTVRVTITSNPPPSKSFGSHYYLLDFDDRRNLRFTELPSPDKADSQP